MTKQAKSIKNNNERTVRTAFPHLMSRGFILDFVPGVKFVVKKNTGMGPTDAPLWLKVKVVAHLNENKLVLILNEMLFYEHLC